MIVPQNVGRMESGELSICEKPKSDSFMMPLSAKRRLSGLKSYRLGVDAVSTRCMIFSLCRSFRPRRQQAAISRITASISFPFLRR